MLAAVAAYYARAATAGKAGKVWSLPRFWVSIPSYKKQPVKKIWGKILGLAWLKFAVASLHSMITKGLLEYLQLKCVSDLSRDLPA